MSVADARRLLTDRGAREIAHPGGTLFDHLNRTWDLLRAWRCPPVVALAGLCHAAYGTDGLDASLLALDERHCLKRVIGEEAEAIVYYYAACDRRFSYSAAIRGAFAYRDRFTGTEVDLPERVRRAFVDITFANEIDLVRNGPGFREETWPRLCPVFDGYRDQAGVGAWAAYQDVSKI